MTPQDPKSLYRHVCKLRAAAKERVLKPGEEDMAAVLDRVADLCIATERGDMESVKRIAFGEEEAPDAD